MKISNVLLILYAVVFSSCLSPSTYTVKVIKHEKETDNTSIIVNELVKSTKTWDGSLLTSYPQGQPEISIRHITIPAGARLSLHHHPVINAGWMLSGQLTVVTADGKKLQLKAGDPVIELVNTKHYGINPGPGPAEIIVFCAGVVGTSTTTIRE